MTVAATIISIFAITGVPALLAFVAIGRWTKLAARIRILVSAGVAGPMPVVGAGLLIDMEQGFCCREHPVTFWSEAPTYALYWSMAAVISLVAVLIAYWLGLGQRKHQAPDQSVFD